MSYNWQNGELITAEKLNQTGGSGNSYAIHVTVGEETGEGVYSCTVAESISDIRNAVEQGKFVFAIMSDGEGSTNTLYLDSTTPTSINLRSLSGDPGYHAPTSSDLACLQLTGAKLPDDDSYEWLFQMWRFASR